MRALRFAHYGPPEVLEVVEVPEPSPAVGEVKIRAGHMRWIPVFPAPPSGLGCDFAGEIVGVGGGAISHYVGERVFGSVLPFRRYGSLAEYIVAAAARVVATTDGLDDAQAAALPI